MAKKDNTPKNENVKNEEIVEEVKNEEVVETTENETNPNVQEHSEIVKQLVEKMKTFVNEYERGWSIKRIEPLKEEVKGLLDKNKENEYLSKSDKNFLYAINRVIYGKVETPPWRRQNEPEQVQNARPENLPAQLQFKSLNDKVARLKQTLAGYGNKSIITTIEDIKEKSFYCLKETEINGKMELECSIKFIELDGVATTSVMTPEEAYAIRDSYMAIKDNPEERNNLSVYVREINNNPVHADRYFEKIALTKENEAELVNSQTIEQEIEE